MNTPASIVIAAGILVGCSSGPKMADSTQDQPTLAKSGSTSLSPAPALQRAPSSSEQKVFNCILADEKNVQPISLTISYYQNGTETGDIDVTGFSRLFSGPSLDDAVYPIQFEQRKNGELVFAGRGYQGLPIMGAVNQVPATKPRAALRAELSVKYSERIDVVEYACCLSAPKPVFVKGEGWVCSALSADKIVDEIRDIVNNGKLNDQQRVREIKKTLSK